MVQQSGDRQHLEVKTTGDGTYLWTGLKTGNHQAYRVNVPYQGASYSATPFQLPSDRGYDVHIRRLPVTHDQRLVLQYLGQVMLELHGNRLHVIQQTQLMNLGDATYVFPASGQEVTLPKGFTGFQAQPVMTDQKVDPTDDGFAVKGSLPPGNVTLTWAFDMNLDGTTMHIGLPVPWHTFMYRVMAAAGPGMHLDVEGMPTAHRNDDSDPPVLETAIRRKPNDPPLDTVEITLRGIPGPGPLRWIAVGGAAVLVLAGLLFALRGGRLAQGSAEGRKLRQKELLDEAVDLERMFAAGEIGPTYHARRMTLVTTELAALLRQKAQAKQRRGKRS